MERVVTASAIVIALAAAFVWGRCVGVRSGAVAENATVTDTVWTEVHDTCWKVEAVSLLRTDTVRLAVANVHENGISGTYTDTLFVHDSVFVEVPIGQKTFVGENWRVTAHGYRVGLDEVWISRPTVYVTKTQTRTKRWAFSVGAQMGYGYTTHGGSPYVGLGVGFGYTF